MLSRFRARLTFANVLSVMSMFIVLGGGAYAASTLPNNSVGTEQIQRDGVTKPDVARSAIGSAELRRDSVKSPEVKDGSLRCLDFRADAPVCQAGVPGDAGLATTTARQHDEAIDLTCDPSQPAPAQGPDAETRRCQATETVKATCAPGEVATGGSSESSSPLRSQETPDGFYNEVITVTDDRPDPAAGTPTGWAADFEVDIFAVSNSGPAPQPPDPTGTVYVVCAS